MHSAVVIPNFASRSIMCTNGRYGGRTYRITVVWKKDSHAFVKWPSFKGRLSTCKKSNCRVRPVENEKVNPIQGKRKEADCVCSNHCSDNLDKEAFDSSTSFDLEWLPTFPHVAMASISNILFGYHIGVMNGPIISIAHELGFEGDQLTEGLVVSIFVVAAFFGSFGSTVLADKIGRQRTLQLDVIPLIIGALVSAEANSLNEMILGRFLVGLGIGANTVLVPIYISEVSPTKYRGSLGTISQLGTCVGMIIALALGVHCESDSHWWRAMFHIASVIGCLLIIGMQFIAESPRWLGKVGRWEEAKKIISQLWGISHVESAIKELKDANNLDISCEESSWSDLLTERHYKAPAIGGTLFCLQQFAGINGVLYFSSLIFADVGIGNNTVASIAVGIANFAGAIIALYLMDKQGRRSLLMGSYIGMVAETRFASNTIVLRRLVKVREALSSMVISHQWNTWRQSNNERAIDIRRRILDETWWSRAEYLLSFTEPILGMIRFTDMDKPCLGEVYDGIDSMIENMRSIINAKEQDPEETFFKEVQFICVERWKKMTTPLHLLAFSLSTKYYSEEILALPTRVPPYRDAEVGEGARKAISKLFPDIEMEDAVTSEFADFVSSKGHTLAAIRDKYRKDAHSWWYLNGHKLPNLQILVIKILSQASSMFLQIIPFGVPVNEPTSHFLSIFGTLMYAFTFAIGAGPITGLIIPELSSTQTRAKTMAFSLCVHWGVTRQEKLELVPTLVGWTTLIPGFQWNFIHFALWVCNFVVGLLFLDTIEKFGLPTVYSSFGIVSLLAAAFTYYYISETKGRSLEEIEFLLNPDLERRD